MAWYDVARSQLGAQAEPVIGFLSNINPSFDWSPYISATVSQLQATTDGGWADPNRGSSAAIANQILGNAQRADPAAPQDRSINDYLYSTGQQQNAQIQAYQAAQGDSGFLGLGDLGNILAIGGLALGGAGLAGYGPLAEALGGVFGAEAGAGALMGAGEGALSLGEFAAGAGAAVPELGVAAAPGLAEAATAAGMGGEPFLTEEMLRQAGPTFFENLQQYTDPFRYANLVRQAADYMGGDQAPSVSFSQGFAPTQVAGSYEDYVPTTYGDYGYDLPGAGGPGTSFPSSIPEPTDVAGAGEGLSFEDILKGVSKYGPLASLVGQVGFGTVGARRAGEGGRRAAGEIAGLQGAGRAGELGAQLAGMGQQQLAAATQGQLAAGDEERLRREYERRIALIRQQAARAGIGPSTQRRQEEQARSEVEAMRQRLSAQNQQRAIAMITQGANLAGISDANMRAAIAARMQGDQQAAQIANNLFAGVGAQLPAALRALSGNTAPATQTVQTTTTTTPA